MKKAFLTLVMVASLGFFASCANKSEPVLEPETVEETQEVITVEEIEATEVVEGEETTIE